jgi:dTDP-L-rhamnose 4-epimerase
MKKATLSAKPKKILVTGGAGFVGSHTVDALVQQGHAVRIFDNLCSQVHGGKIPDYLNSEAEFIPGDVRDLTKLSLAMRGVDVIYHLAAAVGVGQSMYEIAYYTAVNNLGTANLLQAILDTRSQPEKIVVASSMSIYGEGQYSCLECNKDFAPPPRELQQLRAKQWETLCPQCNEPLVPVATVEEKPLQATSVYALSKKDQEQMVLLFGRTYGIPAVALRYFNIYGPRQSLSNPYTGVAAIFSSRLLNGNPPLIFEDGLQMRDFVSVHDVVSANLLAMETSAADGKALNVGSGEPVTIRKVAADIGRALACETPAVLSGKYRAGDIRHCFGSIAAITASLGYKPQIKFENGIRELAAWLLAQQDVADDHLQDAMDTLNIHGLVA